MLLLLQYENMRAAKEVPRYMFRDGFGILKQELDQRPILHECNSYTSLLQACRDIIAVNQVHAHMLRHGFHQNINLETKLISRYAACSSMENARLLFDKMEKPDLFLWNVMIKGYISNGLYEEALTFYCGMRRAGTQPDNFTLPFVFKASTELSVLREGKAIHTHVVKSGFESDVFVGNSLVTMYAKCGNLEIARQLFDKFPERDVVSWGAMIAAYARSEDANEALRLFHQMMLQGVRPDPVIMISMLPACAHAGALHQGKWIHAHMMKIGLDQNISPKLVIMYAMCSSMENARKLFDKISIRNVFLWNVMIRGYVASGLYEDAISLYYQMYGVNAQPDNFTFPSVLQVVVNVSALREGEKIQAHAVKIGFESDVFVGNALLAMYARCGSFAAACKVFDKMCQRDVVSWSTIICSYAQSGLVFEVLTLFHQMQLADVTPDSVTMGSVLQACASLAALQQGKKIHGYVIRSGLETDASVGSALIDMYAKCGSLEISCQLFDKMATKNIVSWSAMISAYGMHGCGELAVAVFAQMQQTDVKPDHITFLSVLSACSHAGLVDEGRKYFDCMIQEYGVMPWVDHFACMVDLLGRAGNLDEAEDFIKKMPLEPTIGVWLSLLGACSVHHNIEIGERVAEQLLARDSANVGCYMLLSNIYADAGRWDDVTKVRKSMKERGLKKLPGCSLIEINNKIHTFFVGDRVHPQSEKNYGMLDALVGQMKEAGYVPSANFVLHDDSY